MSVIKYGRDLPTFLKLFRRDFNLTQKDLADMMGVHPQYVSNVECGRNQRALSFCALLLDLVPSERRIYLMDIIGTLGSNIAIRKVKSLHNDGRVNAVKKRKKLQERVIKRKKADERRQAAKASGGDSLKNSGQVST